jgi:hypothetical protein
VNDLTNDDTGDIWMDAASGRIDGGSVVGSHYWGTFTFHDNWQTVTILNHSARKLIIDDIDVINRDGRRWSTRTPPAARSQTRSSRSCQVDPSLVTITNDFSRSAVAADLEINGTILNDRRDRHHDSYGAITSSSKRSGSSTYDGTHSA